MGGNEYPCADCRVRISGNICIALSGSGESGRLQAANAFNEMMANRIFVRYLLSLVAAFSFISASRGAALQSGAQPDTGAETVVVTGERPSAGDRDEVVRSFVGAHAKRSPKINHLIRWSAPVCPEVRNLPAAFADFITTRIKVIAAAVGAPTKEDCKPNIEIIFTPQPQLLMDKLANTTPVVLGFHFVHATKSLAKVVQPVQAWYVTGTTNGARTYIDDPYHGTPDGATGSRLSDGLASVFINVLIVANTDIVAGRPIGPIADYMAMLALSQAATDDDCTELPSILDLLSANCPNAEVQSLTVTDEAFLKGLYGTPPGLYSSLQRSDIAHRMIRSFDEPAKPSATPNR